MRKILFILRGRPGLGHVIPGLSIARAMEERGFMIHIITYANGSRFLKESNWNASQWENLDINENYYDWPGLDIYDDGLGLLVDRINKINPSMIILGGEYQLGLLASVFNEIPFCMLFNPEIFEKNQRNDRTVKLFFKFFEDCKFLLPLTRLKNNNYYDDLLKMQHKFIANGPYVITPEKNRINRKVGLNVLIANGGGVNFPKCSVSYSSDLQDTNSWLRQTEMMTAAAVSDVCDLLSGEGRAFVFSCLQNESAQNLKKEFSIHKNLSVLDVSMQYYDVLHNSDLIISRAGAGFIADACSTEAIVILWVLEGHDEQLRNAQELAKTRKNTYLCKERTELNNLIKSCISSLKEGVRDKEISLFDHYRKNVSVTVDKLLSYV